MPDHTHLLNCINLGNYLIYDTNEGEPAIDISAHNPPSTPVATATIDNINFAHRTHFANLFKRQQESA